MSHVPNSVIELRAMATLDGAVRIADDELDQWMHLIPSWTRADATAIRLDMQFANFRDAFGHATRIAMIAEARNHHPDLEVGWGRCSVHLSTHSAGGVTPNDIVLAALIDELD